MLNFDTILPGENDDNCRDPKYLYSLLKNTVAAFRDVHQELEDLKHVQLENECLIGYLSQRLAIYHLGDFATLPHAILLRIFRDALPPPWLLSGSKTLLPNPLDISWVDLRTKLSILAVCKSWNRVGTELLYERVTLRRILHLSVFVRALESREGLGALVRHLNVDCFVPHGYSRLYGTETERILKLCPNLSHIGVSPPFWIPGLPCLLPPMSSTITSLEFSRGFPYSTILPFLVELSHNLKSLVLSLPAVDDQHPALTFDKLEVLGLDVDNESEFPASKWRIPALRRLWVSFHGVRHHEILTHLLEAYGATLTSLRLPRTSREFHVQPLLDRCPLLESLTLHEDAAKSVHHQTVKFIDIFCVEKPRADSLEARFPSLRRYRNLAFMASMFRDLPFPDEKEPQAENSEPEEAAAGDPNEDEPESTKIQGEEEIIKVLESLPEMLEFMDPRSVHGLATDNFGEFYWGWEDIPQRRSDYDSDGCSYSESDAITVSEDLADLNDAVRADGEDREIGHDEAIELFYSTRTLESPNTLL
ncbi:hypothetical protein C8F04DRAFT_1066966 [Mycena alexandri]|uniref:F-box domain-containing protein n=1 Tax=Mycena alexandri TaxID=1745969 RepID=A0AAD6TIL8_9AGAR|nr:hypothetical protein C8F04DRAFT_1066966 [Mycena alexandri]